MLSRVSVNGAALGLILAALVYGVYAMPLAEWLAYVVDWAQQRPLLGPVTYVACVAVATVLFVPGSGSMMIAGFLFGLMPGMLFAAIAVSVGAQCAFLAGRAGARGWVEKKVAANRRLHAIERGLREEAFLIVALTRLSLVIPFNMLNYAYGVTSVTARTHLFATALGMLPAVGLYVYLGTLARDLEQILSGKATPSEFGYWMAAAAVTAVVVLTWTIHRAASRALERHLSSMETDDAQ